MSWKKCKHFGVGFGKEKAITKVASGSGISKKKQLRSRRTTAARHYHGRAAVGTKTSKQALAVRHAIPCARLCMRLKHHRRAKKACVVCSNFNTFNRCYFKNPSLLMTPLHCVISNFEERKCSIVNKRLFPEVFTVVSFFMSYVKNGT